MCDFTRLSTDVPAWILVTAPWQSEQSCIAPSSTEWIRHAADAVSTVLPAESFFTW